LEYIAAQLQEYIGKTWNEIKEEMQLPLEINEFLDLQNKLKEESKKINDIIINCQSEIDNIIFKLFELNNEEINIIENNI